MPGDEDSPENSKFDGAMFEVDLLVCCADLPELVRAFLGGTQIPDSFDEHLSWRGHAPLRAPPGDNRSFKIALEKD